MGNRKQKKSFLLPLQLRSLRIENDDSHSESLLEKKKKISSSLFSAIKTTIKIDAFLAVFSGSKKSHLVGK